MHLRSLLRLFSALLLCLLAICAYFCFSSIVIVPHLVSTNYIRKQINNATSKNLSTQIRFGKLEIDYEPFPGIEFSGFSLHFPPKLKLRTESLNVYPDIFALLKGKIKIANIRLKKPRTDIYLSEKLLITREDIKALLESKYKSIFYGLNLEITQGVLRLHKGGKLLHSFDNIHLESEILPRLRYKLSCDSGLWEKLRLQGRGNLDNFRFKQSLSLRKFKPQKIDKLCVPYPTELRPGNSTVTLQAKLRSQGFKDLNASIALQAPRITLLRDNKSQKLQDTKLQAQILRQDSIYDLELQELKIQKPHLNLQGKMHYNSQSAETKIQLTSRTIGLTSIRKLCLGLLGDIKGIQPTFKIVKAGEISELNMTSRGSSIRKALADPELNATMTEGKIYIPGLNMDLHSAQGKIRIKNNTLRGYDLRSKWKKSQSSSGKLTLGLNSKLSPFFLNTDINCDLSVLPGILRKTISGSSVLNILEKFDNIRGSSSANLNLERTKEKWDLQIKAESIDAQAQFKPYTLPLELTCEEFYYSPQKRLQIQNMDTALGNSEISDLSGKLLSRDNSSEFNLETKSAKLDIQQLMPLVKDNLNSTEILSEGTKKKFLEDIRDSKGKLKLHRFRIRGELPKPGQLKYSLQGKLQDFQCKYQNLPISVEKTNIDLNSTSLELRNCSVNFLNSRAILNAEFKDYKQGCSQSELELQGSFGSDFISRSLDYLDINNKFSPRAPLRVKESRVQWNRNQNTTVRADITVANKTRLSFDMEKSPRKINLRNLRIRDKYSCASLKLQIQDRLLQLGFKGKITDKTLDTLIGKNQMFDGVVTGNFNSTLETYPPRIISARGKLQVQDFYSDYLKELRIKNLEILSKKNRLLVNPSRFYWREIPIQTQGKIELGPKYNKLDLDCFIKDMHWQNLKKILKNNPDSGKSRPLYSSLKGEIDLRSNSFFYQDLEFKPFKVSISLKHEHKIPIDISRTQICSIPVNGTIQTNGENTRFLFNIKGKELNMQKTIGCLESRDQDKLITGEMNISGNIAGNTNGSSSLKDSLKGKVKLIAKNGRVYKINIISKIISFLNTTEVIFGQMPDFQKRGFGYNRIIIKAKLRDQELKITKGIVLGKTMEMTFQGDVNIANQKTNLIFLVAPLKTLDRLIKLIPIVNIIFKGNLVSVPVQVVGKISDPAVIPLSPQAVGSEFLGIMERALKLPITVFEPLVSEEN